MQLSLVLFIISVILSTAKIRHKQRRFIHNRFHKRFNDVHNGKLYPTQPNHDSENEEYLDKAKNKVFIPKDERFLLKCPKSASEHWDNKINFTIDWSLDGLRYLTILRRNSFPKLEFINHYAKILKQHRRKITRFRFPYLSIQQWPNIDGKSASAIVYLNPDNEDDKPITQEGITAGKYYKFEVEERRQWFVLRIPRPKLARDQGFWECHMTIYVPKWEDSRETQVVRLESRKMLARPSRQRHAKPYIEFQKASRRKTRTQQLENSNADAEQFEFGSADEKSIVIPRRVSSNEVQFSRKNDDVQFTRDDFYAYHKNTSESTDEEQPEKILMLPAADGLLWSRWFSSHEGDDNGYQTEYRKYWWQNSNDFNAAASINASQACWNLYLLTFVDFCLVIYYYYL